MRLVRADGTIARDRRFVSGGQNVSEADVGDPKKLAETLRLALARISELEAQVPGSGVEFEVTLPTGGSTVSLAHGLSGPVRYYVTQWGHGNNTYSPMAAPVLARDDTSTDDVLVLRSFVAGNAIVRVEPAQASIDPGISIGDRIIGAEYNNFFYSPSEQGKIFNAGKAGDFTFGLGYNFMRPVTITAVKLFCAWAATKSVKIRIHNLTDAASVYTETFTGLSSGMNTLVLATPQAITSLAKTYIVSAYETTGGVYAGYLGDVLLNGPFATFPWVAGPAAIMRNSYYVAGDNVPTTTGSADLPSCEPIFTI